MTRRTIFFRRWPNQRTPHQIIVHNVAETATIRRLTKSGATVLSVWSFK